MAWFLDPPHPDQTFGSDLDAAFRQRGADRRIGGR